MTDKLRVAVAGAGIGGDHVVGYLANPDLYEVVTVCDLKERRAQRLADYAGAQPSGDYTDALAREDIDILDVCLPPELHKQAILDGLAAGKHVICEKPLVGSVADADEIIEAAATSATKVIPIFQYRFGNGIGKLCYLIEQGLAGKPLVASLETHWNRDAEYYSVPWRGKWDTELGGALVGHAIHAHDLLVKVMGPIHSVQATLATRVNEIEVDDCAAISMQLDNGALATSSITLGSATDQSRLRFCFSKLSAESDGSVHPYNPGTSPWHFHAREPADQAEVDAALETYVEHQEGFARQLELAYQCIVADAPPPVSLTEAKGALSLIAAIYQSNQAGQRVYLDQLSDTDWYQSWVPPERRIHDPVNR